LKEKAKKKIWFQLRKTWENEDKFSAKAVDGFEGERTV